MQYNYYSRNSGKDLIYSTRLRLAEKLGVSLSTTKSSKMYNYLMNASLGVILN